MSQFLRGASCASLAAALLLAGCTKEAAPPDTDASVVAAPSSANASIANGIMMQGFYWDAPSTTPAGSWWQNLSSKAQELSDADVTALWLPPAYKDGSGFDVGYGVSDRYDLGEFNQKGTVATRHGTLGQL